MRALIRYEENGHKEMSVQAVHISSEMWWGDRTQTCMAAVILSDGEPAVGGTVQRTIQLSAVYAIDVDRTEGIGG